MLEEIWKSSLPGKLWKFQQFSFRNRFKNVLILRLWSKNTVWRRLRRATDLYAFVEHWDFASPTLDPKCSKTPPKASGMHPIVVLGWFLVVWHRFQGFWHVSECFPIVFPLFFLENPSKSFKIHYGATVRRIRSPKPQNRYGQVGTRGTIERAWNHIPYGRTGLCDG